MPERLISVCDGDIHEFVNDLTKMLDEYRKKQIDGPLRFNTYIMELARTENKQAHAIRYPGATRGNLWTDGKGVITHIAIDEEFYGEAAQEAMKQFVGMQLYFIYEE